jgi:hypothetical protein
MEVPTYTHTCVCTYTGQLAAGVFPVAVLEFLWLLSLVQEGSLRVPDGTLEEGEAGLSEGSTGPPGNSCFEPTLSPVPGNSTRALPGNPFPENHL